jgi:hypothetical protein
MNVIKTGLSCMHCTDSRACTRGAALISMELNKTIPKKKTFKASTWAYLICSLTSV